MFRAIGRGGGSGGRARSCRGGGRGGRRAWRRGHRGGVRILRAGGVVGVPTETVYGVAGDAKNPDAIARLFALKGRPDGRPLPVLLPDVDALLAWCPEAAWRRASLAAAFWPGPLTMVVARPSGLPDALTWRAEPWACACLDTPSLWRCCALSVAGSRFPSANRHGEVSATDAASARAAFGADLGLVLDGGLRRKASSRRWSI
ncbi:MAG: Sua5/YciO/YrdC/YwlC family protein [Myxococcota bacterium]